MPSNAPTGREAGSLYGPYPTGQAPPGALDKAAPGGGTRSATPYVPYIPPAGQGQYQSGIPGAGMQGPQGPQGPPTQLSPSLVPGAPGHAVLGSNPDQRLPITDVHADTTKNDPNQITYNNEYVDKFNASMAAQRGAIDNALTTALTSLGARRDAASKVVAGIPQQIKDTYDQTDTKQSGVMATAQKAVGPRGAPGGAANAALYANDNEAAKKSGLSVQPLLQAGVQSNYDLGEAGLNQAHLEGLSQLNSQQAQFDASMAAGQQARNYALEDRQFAIDHPELDPSTRLTADQRVDNAAQAAAAAEDTRRYNETQKTTQDAGAQTEGYTSYAGKQKGESLAKFFTRPDHLDVKTLGKMYDFDTLLALKNFHAITDKEFYEASGTTAPKK